MGRNHFCFRRNRTKNIAFGQLGGVIQSGQEANNALMFISYGETLFSGDDYLNPPICQIYSLLWTAVLPDLRKCHVGVEILKPGFVTAFHVCELGEEELLLRIS